MFCIPGTISHHLLSRPGCTTQPVPTVLFSLGGLFGCGFPSCVCWCAIFHQPATLEVNYTSLGDPHSLSQPATVTRSLWESTAMRSTTLASLAVGVATVVSAGKLIVETSQFTHQGLSPGDYDEPGYRRNGGGPRYTGVAFHPTGSSPGFECRYPTLNAYEWEACNTPQERSCWLRKKVPRKDGRQYGFDVFTDCTLFAALCIACCVC